MILMSPFTILKPKQNKSADLRKEPPKLLESHLEFGLRNVKRQRMPENALNIGRTNLRPSIKIV